MARNRPLRLSTHLQELSRPFRLAPCTPFPFPATPRDHERPQASEVRAIQTISYVLNPHPPFQRKNSQQFRKFPQFQQNEIFGLTDAFRKLDVDDKGYLDEATAIKATQASERQPYDVVRQALKEVELDSSRRVELEDYVGVSAASKSMLHRGNAGRWARCRIRNRD